MTLRRVRTAALAAILVLPAGCGGDSSDSETSGSSSTTVEPTTTTTTVPTTTTESTTTTSPFMTMEEAATHYLTIVAPLNCSIERLNALVLDDGAPYLEVSETTFSGWLADVPPLQQEVADQTLRWIEAMAAASWPEDLQTSIEALISESAELALYAQQWAEVATFDDLIAMNAVPYPAAPSATIVRAKLGLDSNIGSGAKTDHCADET